jgi:hypothetical protein
LTNFFNDKQIQKNLKNNFSKLFSRKQTKHNLNNLYVQGKKFRRKVENYPIYSLEMALVCGICPLIKRLDIFFNSIPIQ